MERKDYINLAAIIVGPIIGIIITISYQRRYQKIQSKHNLFLTLVSHRLQFPLKTQFVEALNTIDIVFYKNKDVRYSWQRLHDILNATSTWDEKRNAIADLLSTMGECLGYKGIKQTKYLAPYVAQGLSAAADRKDKLEQEATEFFTNWNKGAFIQPPQNVIDSDNVS